MDGTGMVVPDVRTWPWKDIAPGRLQVVRRTRTRSRSATRTLTPDEVAALGITDPEGGFSGLIVNGPGTGSSTRLRVRPLLPDETE